MLGSDSAQVIDGAVDAEASKEGHAGFDHGFGFGHDAGPAPEPGEPMALLGVGPFDPVGLVFALVESPDRD